MAITPMNSVHAKGASNASFAWYTSPVRCYFQKVVWCHWFLSTTFCAVCVAGLFGYFCISCVRVAMPAFF